MFVIRVTIRLCSLFKVRRHVIIDVSIMKCSSRPPLWATYEVIIQDTTKIRLQQKFKHFWKSNQGPFSLELFALTFRLGLQPRTWTEFKFLWMTFQQILHQWKLELWYKKELIYHFERWHTDDVIAANLVGIEIASLLGYWNNKLKEITTTHLIICGHNLHSNWHWLNALW